MSAKTNHDNSTSHLPKYNEFCKQVIEQFKLDNNGNLTVIKKLNDFDNSIQEAINDFEATCSQLKFRIEHLNKINDLLKKIKIKNEVYIQFDICGESIDKKFTCINSDFYNRNKNGEIEYDVKKITYLYNDAKEFYKQYIKLYDEYNKMYSKTCNQFRSELKNNIYFGVNKENKIEIKSCFDNNDKQFITFKENNESLLLIVDNNLENKWTTLIEKYSNAKKNMTNSMIYMKFYNSLNDDKKKRIFKINNRTKLSKYKYLHR